jgi:nanoRNase/pAp phosphatase (c-di-AMP/oligoRNAs hydrolase)
MLDPARVQEVLRRGRRLLIFLHDNPDPDAIAAGWILQHIAKHVGVVRSRILYGGRLGRAENRAMVQLLHIPLRRIDPARARLVRGDITALVDTQPQTGNNSYPELRRPNLVIDHHPARRDLQAELVDIRPDEGCCTTMLLEYHLAFGLSIDPRLATAAAYAISSETQDLGREATRADREAYQRVFPQVRLTVLGKIRHPARDREYYRVIARAMRRVELARNSAVCHIGPVPYAEVVAEVADLLIPMRQVSWCMVTGVYGGVMSVSLRTTRPKARADRVVKRVLGKLGRGGGHGMLAGGSLPCPDEATYAELAPQLSQRFLRQISRRVPERLRPLLEGEPPVAPPAEPLKEVGSPPAG